MDFKRATAIYDPSRQVNGTGYLISENLILTCHHVIAPENEPGISGKKYDIRFQGDYVSGHQEWYDYGCSLYWDSPEHDIAVLKLERDKPVFITDDSPGLRIGRLEGEMMPAKGVGFPSGQRVRDRQNPEELQGNLSWISGQGENQLRLHVKSPMPEKPRDWMGISGTALFVENYLVGIIVETNKGLSKKTLWAVPAAILSDNQEFRQLLREDIEVPLTIDTLPRQSKSADLSISPGESIRALQQRLIRSYAIFGGRKRELRRLNSLLNTSSKKFHFVTGPSGIGKTALLVNWMTDLEKRGENVCYHFINRNFGMANPYQALQNLCEQLIIIQKRGQELSLGMEKLNGLYTRLLKNYNSKKRMVVIIDGIDEADPQKHIAGLLPPVLPDKVSLFFSARTDSGESRKKILSQLGLQETEFETFIIDRISKAGIPDLLIAAQGKAPSLADDPEFVENVFEVSKGNPFYLRFLVEDISSGEITRQNIGKQPIGINAYLDNWRDDLYQDVDIERDECVELLGLLAAAKGPITVQELKQLSPLLQKGAILDRELSGNLRRYLKTERTNGYALCHPLFQDYLRLNIFSSGLEQDEASFDRRLLSYCENWSDHGSGYALDYFLSHLRDAGREPEIFRLMNRDWKEKRFDRDLSPRGFSNDVETAIALARESTEPHLYHCIRCAFIYANLVTLANRLPNDVYGAMVYMDRVVPALDYIALNRDPQNRIQACMVVGRALLNSERIAEHENFIRLIMVYIQNLDESREENRGQKLEAIMNMVDLLSIIQKKFPAVCVLESLDLCFYDIQRLGLLEKNPGKLKKISHTMRKLQKNDLADYYLTLGRKAEKAAQKNSLFNFSGLDFKFDFDFRIPTELERSTQEKKENGELKDAVEAIDLYLESLDSDESNFRKGLCDVIRAYLVAGEKGRAKRAALRLSDLKVVAGQDPEDPKSQAALLVETAELLLDSGCIEEAEAYAYDAIFNLKSNSGDTTHAKPEWLWAMGWDEQRVGRVIEKFLEEGFADVARGLGRELAEELLSDLIPDRSGRLSWFAPILGRLGLTDQAASLVENIVKEKGRPGYNELKIKAKLAWCRSLAAVNLSDMANRIMEPMHLDLVIEASGSSGPEDQTRAQSLLAKSAALEDLVFTKLTLSPEADLAEERDIAESLTGYDRAILLDAIAKGAAKSGKRSEAAHLVNRIVTETINKENHTVRDEMILKLCHTMALSGNSDWAVNQSNKINPSSQALREQKRIVRLTVNDTDYASSLVHKSVTLNLDFLEADLVALIRALKFIGESGQADDLLSRAKKAVLAGVTKKQWNLLPFFRLGMALGKAKDIDALNELHAAVERSSDTHWRMRALMNLIPGYLSANDRDTATDISDTIIIHLEQRQCSYDKLEELPYLLATIPSAENILRLEELYAIDYQTPVFYSSLIRGYGKLRAPEGIRRMQAKVETLADSNKTLRPWWHAVLWSSLALAFNDCGDLDSAATAGKKARNYFEDETDGQFTPKVLNVLVPALLAIEDQNGLTAVLNMPRDKCPYEREFIPAWRLIFPALARLGCHEHLKDKRYLEVFKRLDPSEFYASESEVACILASQKKLDTALDTFENIEDELFQSHAGIGIARILIDHGQSDKAKALIDSALTPLVGVKASRARKFCPGHPLPIDILSDAASLLNNLNDDQKGDRTVRRELLSRIVDGFVKFDQKPFREGLPLFIKNSPVHDINSIEKILGAAGAESRALATSEIMWAFAQNNQKGQVLKRASGIKTLLKQVDDTAIKAVVHANIARSLWACDRKDEACNMLAMAFDSSRHTGIATFYKVFSDSSDIIAERVDALDLEKSLNDIETWWS